MTGGGAAFPSVQGLSLLKAPYGRITAYDMNKGTIAWQIANGDTPANVKNHPALQGLNIPKTGSSRLVGLLVTKTLLFAGDGTNPLLHAYDKKTGEDIAVAQVGSFQRRNRFLPQCRCEVDQVALLQSLLTKSWRL